MKIFFLNPADTTYSSICESSASRLFIQYSCIENTEFVEAKSLDIRIVAFIEFLTVLLFIATLRFNKSSTEMMGKEYDEASITASTYSVLINVTAAHRFEFNEKYGSKLDA